VKVTTPLQTRHRRTWFIALLATFALNGIYFATWVSRTPETEKLLGLDTVGYGFFAMILGFGALLSVIFGARLLRRLGSRRSLLIAYLGMSFAFALTGWAITLGSLPLAVICNLMMGLFFGLSNFANNIEATDVDRVSPRSLLPPLHGSYSAGLLVGSALGALAIAGHLSLTLDFDAIAIFTAIAGIIATRFLPRDADLFKRGGSNSAPAPAQATPAQRRAVWREPRTYGLSAIALAFVLAEYAAATWLPIYLVNSGMSAEAGAIGFFCFAIAMAAGRLLGGLVAERVPRPVLLAIMAFICIVGIVLVMLTALIPFAFLGAVLWGLGTSLGYPLVSSALAEDPLLSPARIRVLLVFMNAAILSVGPALGAVGQLAGLTVAIAIPAVLLVVAGSTTRIARPLPGFGKEAEFSDPRLPPI